MHPDLKPEELEEIFRAERANGPGLANEELSFFNYLHIMLAAAFGIIWAVSKNPRTRSLALVVSLLTIPWFLLDRTRNTMLAVALPSCWPGCLCD